MQTLQ